VRVRVRGYQRGEGVFGFHPKCDSVAAETLFFLKKECS